MSLKSLFEDKRVRYTLLACVALLIAFSACHKINQYFGMKDDNAAEEILERVIEVKIGVDIDLTPASPEN